MRKQLQSKTVYQPNPSVKVTVVNKPDIDEDGRRIGFTAAVTVNYRVSKLDELKFETDDDIAEFMGAIDYTDPQTELEL